MQTGTNTIEGRISYPDEAITTNRIVVKAYDKFNEAMTYKTEIYGLGYYKIQNVPNIANCMVEAFVTYNNWEMMPSAGAPQAKVGPFDLTAVGAAPAAATKNIVLGKVAVTKSTATVTIRIRVQDNQGNPIGGAKVRMFDTGGFNDWMPENDIFITSGTQTTSNSWSWADGEKYNFVLSSKTVNCSQNYMNYNYDFRVSKDGYRQSSMNRSFQTNEDGSATRPIDIWMEAKPVVTVSNLAITPANREISPDNDGLNDRATFKFKYSVASSVQNWSNGAQAKLVIDTNGDNQYTPMNWGMFVYIDGKEFIKWKRDPNFPNDPDKGSPDPTAFIDYMSPDYTKLKGPISWEEKDKYSAGFDATMDWMIDSWGLTAEGTSMSQNVEMVWEGKDNRWQPLKNNTNPGYKWKLMLDDPGQFDAEDGLIYSTTGTIKVQTSSIKGYVQKADGTPIEGARVNAGGPMAWGETFTDSTGFFEVSGLRISGPNEYYFLSAEAKGYVRKELPNQTIPGTGTLDLTTTPIKLDGGVKVSGNIIIPNPPKKGTLRDQMGNQIFDLWGRIEAYRTDGPGWYSAEVRIPLLETTQTSLSAPYELYLEPGNFNMQVNIPGYVSQAASLTMETAAKTQDINMTKSAVLTGRIKLPITSTPNTAAATAEIAALQAEAQKKGFWGGIWINIHAESKDRKSSANGGVSFDFF